MRVMVIEHFGAHTRAIGERFQRHGRMLPAGVTYISSWVDPANPDNVRCFQLMETPDVASLKPWLDFWADLATFQLVPVVTSKDFWAQVR